MTINHLKASFVSALVLLTCSLAAQGKVLDEATSIGAASDSNSCTTGQATVMVSRDDRRRGSAINSRIILDGEELGEITRGQRVQYCVSTGERIIGVASDFFGGRGAQKRELAVDFKPDKSYAFRVFILHANGAMIERTAL